ncbi:MAG: hypothetical protein C0P79_009360 [Gammaproteobacteria bacterium]
MRLSRRVPVAVCVLFLAGEACGDTRVEIDFIPMTPAHAPAARAYEAIWKEFGERIVAALEARTCLPFSETRLAAIVDDAPSHSGGPHYPMRLRAGYSREVKQSTLVHELGHRHLWQLVERLDGVDGHRTLYLILDRVWADVWGEEFARQRIATESSWKADYDYASAWAWAETLPGAEKERLWRRLLEMNGFDGCSLSPVLLRTGVTAATNDP